MANIEPTWLGSWSRCRDVRDNSNHMRAVAAVKLAGAFSPRWLDKNHLSSSTKLIFETSDTLLCYF
jgi:hypothetical protein